MGQLVEFPLESGGSILIEAYPTTTSGSPVTRGFRGEQVAERASHTFEDAVERIEPAAQAIINRLRQMAESPDEVGVEFGLGVDAGAKAIITADAKANFKITMIWRHARIR